MDEETLDQSLKKSIDETTIDFLREKVREEMMKVEAEMLKKQTKKYLDKMRKNLYRY